MGNLFVDHAIFPASNIVNVSKSKGRLLWLLNTIIFPEKITIIVSGVNYTAMPLKTEKYSVLRVFMIR